MSYGYGNAYASNFYNQSATISSGVNSVNLFSRYRASDPWSLKALLGLSTFNSTANRSIGFIGNGSTLSASSNGNGWTAAVEADYSILLTMPTAATQVLLKPMLGLAWGAYQQTGFSESGNALALSVNGATANSLMATAGLQFSTSPLPLNHNRTLHRRPSLMIAYQVDALANNTANQTLTYSLIDAPATCIACNAQGQNLGVNALLVAGGLEFQVGKETSIDMNASYNAYSNAGQFDYGGGVRLRF